MAEFYFDRKIQIMKNDLGLKEAPILNVERDYNDPDLRYVLYLAFPQLHARGEGEGYDASEMPFDSIMIRYDKNGIVMEKLETESVQNDGGIAGGGKVEVEFKRENFIPFYARNEQVKDVENEIRGAEPTTMCMGGYRINLATSDGFRYNVKNSKEDDLSGIGRIILYRKAEPKKTTVIYFAVNFGFKRKILYSIKKDRLVFSGRNICDKIPVKILLNKDRYPCLKSDLTGEVISKVVEFNGKSQVTLKNAIPVRYNGYKIHITFDLGYRADPSAEDATVPYAELDKFYMLECAENYTLNLQRKEYKRPPKLPFCPYCHRPLVSKYKKGSSHCQELSPGVQETKITLEGINGKGLAKGAVWCHEDLVRGGHSLFARVLPKDYLNRQNFKLAILGSGRSGKTTYISRMFNVMGSHGDIMMHADSLERALGKRSDRRDLCKITDYEIKQINYIKSDVYRLSDSAWYRKDGPREFYERYMFDLTEGRFPRATDASTSATDIADDTFKYPFILDVNDKHYVSLYDIAGEDVERDRDRLHKLFDNAPIGVFYIINGEMDAIGAAKAQRSLREILNAIDTTACPFAVIVSKFDRLEKEFDENCHCLRSDARDMMENSYEGSALERSINLSSAEIEAYLNDKGLNPFKGIKDLNVKYFSASSFSAPDSIYHRDGGEKSQGEVNYLKYLSSPKRMELPVVWMLKQFGCIT